jgi:hypothetical protein
MFSVEWIRESERNVLSESESELPIRGSEINGIGIAEHNKNSILSFVVLSMRL